MAPHPIADSLRVGSFGSALLAAVLVTVFLSVGEARAVLEDGPVTCDGLGGACIPEEKDLFDISGPFIVSDADVGGDPVFAIFAGEDGIFLDFADLATGNTVEQLGFELIGLESTQDLAVGTLSSCKSLKQTNCVLFFNWRTIPTSRPEVTNDGETQTLQWPRFTNGDPKLGSIIFIRLSAELVNGPVICEGRGIGVCTPTEKDLFDIAPPYIVFDADEGGDPVFGIFADEEEISLDFTEFARMSTVENLGFRLTGLESTPDLAVGTITDECASLEQTYCVEFLNWRTKPTSRPSITNDDGIQTLEWSSLGGDPQLGSIANIRVLPEPSASALATAALATLGLIGLAARRRRP